ncbi:MAG TPA: hypothetical protein GXZ79_03115 [Acholeplasma sp.]|nr:hypothetical protein [Acholeplasma sp.]
MKKMIKVFWVVLLLLAMAACGSNEDSTTYEVLVNENIQTVFIVGDSFTAKSYFTIKGSDNSTITIEDSMIDTSNVDMTKAGTFDIFITFEGQTKKVTITVNEKPVTYTIEINEEISPKILKNSSNIDFTKYFIITDSNNKNIPVLETMLDISQVNLNEVGTYKVILSFNDLTKEIYLEVYEESDVPVTYEISINTHVSTTININESNVDFTKYFTITDSNNKNIPVTNAMLNLNELNLNKAGTYNISITYKDVTKTLSITVFEEPTTYDILINESLPTRFEINTDDIDFKAYFTILDNKGNQITVSNSMIDSTNVDYGVEGTYVVYILYQGIEKEISITFYKEEIIEDFDVLFDLIKNLEINNKGTATSKNQIRIKGTIFIDVKNETKLVFITDGKSVIRLYGDRMHNYTAPGNVYEVYGYYKSHIYQPTFEVVAPSKDIKKLNDETPITEINVKEVSLQEIVNLKRESFVENIENGYLQSLLKVKGYLQHDSSNSKRFDYALTTTIGYKKNITGHINNALYFKNDIAELRENPTPLEQVLIDYEVDPKKDDNIEVEIFGVIYDWNPDSKNWRIYVAEDMTIDYLTSKK